MSTESTTSLAADRSARRGLWWMASGVLVAALVLGWFLRERGSPAASVSILPASHVIHAFPGPALDRLIPARWGWLWKLRYAVFGKPASVEVEHVLFRFSPDVEGPFLDASARPALVTSNGVSAWVMELEDATKLKKRFAEQPGVESRVGRVSLGAGVVATISSSAGTPVPGAPVPAGTSATYAVRPRGGGVEIRGAFVGWEVAATLSTEATEAFREFPLETNLMMAASMFVPEGRAVYLQSARTNLGRGTRAAVLILPRIK